MQYLHQPRHRRNVPGWAKEASDQAHLDSCLAANLRPDVQFAVLEQGRRKGPTSQLMSALRPPVAGSGRLSLGQILGMNITEGRGGKSIGAGNISGAEIFDRGARGMLAFGLYRRVVSAWEWTGTPAQVYGGA